MCCHVYNGTYFNFAESSGNVSTVSIGFAETSGGTTSPASSHRTLSTSPIFYTCKQRTFNMCHKTLLLLSVKRINNSKKNISPCIFFFMFQRSKPELVSWWSAQPVGPDEVTRTVSALALSLITPAHS